MPIPRLSLILTAAACAAAMAGPAWAQAKKPAPKPAAHAHEMKAASEAKAAPADDAALIKSAMSAAPAAVGQGATIIDMGASGMREVRKGDNGFTCMADNPATPGPDPMCGDANAMEWAMAWINKKTPPSNKVGFMYMLEGGTDASNTDPYATKPTAENNWVKTGPHVMIVGAAGMTSDYPTAPAPDTSKPYVMWAGTPYAHLMIPVR